MSGASPFGPAVLNVAPTAAAAPKAEEIVLNFTTTDKASIDHGIKMLVYGASGAGKTVLAGTMPSPLIISAEQGLLSLRGKSIPVITVTTAAEVDAALTWCRLYAAKQGILSVALDSISEIVEKVLFSERLKTKDPRQAYGAMADRAIQMVKDFRDLKGFHVLVIAKQMTGKDPMTGLEKASPTAPGQQVGPALPYLFDEVFHAFTDKDANGDTYHALRTHAAFNAEAKDRSGALDEVEYPDISNIISKIKAAPPKV
jgi:hypothetical protein